MALLNPPNILPELGFITFRLLAANAGGLDWETMYQMLVPNPSLLRSEPDDPTANSVGKDPLNQTIRALRDIGFLRFDEGRICLSNPVDPPESRAEDRRRFVTELTACIMRSSVSEDQRWGKDAPGALDLTRSLSFLLVQDPHRVSYYPSGKTHPHIEEVAVDLEAQRIEHIGTGDDDAQVLHNDERWQSFVRWASALGFLEQVPPPSIASRSRQLLVRIDPTRAVSLAVDTLPSGTHSAPDFLRLLSERLPIIPPYGELFADLVEHWSGALPFGEAEVPPSVATALLRLEASGKLRLGRGADAPEVSRLLVAYPWNGQTQMAEQVARVEVP